MFDYSYVINRINNISSNMNCDHTNEYSFLQSNPNLDQNIILIGLGGSHAYGTNNADSDLDIRGVATNSGRNIIIGKDFEQVVDIETDTTIYSFDKIVKLLCSCNPNTIEMLGLKPEHYLYISSLGKLLIKNKKLFLSQIAAYTFGGYAHAQLRRLENKAARLVSQSEQEAHILRSINHAEIELNTRYQQKDKDAIKLYIDKTDREGYDTEIFADVNLKHYPLRDFKDYMNDFNAVIRSYSKIGKRNEKAIEHNKLGKHMMHLVRLYLMCFDILEKEEINTYREDEHDFLMSIRNGEYLDDNRQPIPEFYDIVNEYESRLAYAQNNTSLPEKVDIEAVNDLLEEVNLRVVCDSHRCQIS